MERRRIAITGSSGLIGTALIERLRGLGDSVVRIVRRDPGPGEIRWDPSAGKLDPADLTGVDAVINLAGAGIGNRRWSASYRRTLRASRIDGTRLLANTLAALDHPPAVLISASGQDFYGKSETATFDESSPSGRGFLAELCRAWEDATTLAEQAGIRVVHIRSALVLSASGGVLPKFVLPMKFGLGGRFGSGRQWQSWISIDDEVAAIVHLLDSSVAGPVNLASPSAVTNAEFTRILARVLRRPSLLTVPRFAPRLVLGREMADALLFEGLRVVPKVLSEDGFRFGDTQLEPALRRLLGKPLPAGGGSR